MKKKLGIVLSFVLAFAMSLALFAGCGGKKENKDDVTVTLSPTTATIETGKTRKLTAIVSDGVSEVEWSSSDDSIASVDGGTVKGESAGKATITATVKGGTANATCEVTVKDPVTVTFKNADGETVTSVTVDRAGVDSVQLTATASDGSAITSWSSSDETVATVDNTGLVKAGSKEGSITVTARSSTGSGSITVTTIDSYDGVHYQIVNESEAEAGQWYYWNRTDGGREWAINGEYRDETITFDYDGGNWNSDDMFLAYKNTDLTDGGTWYNLTMNVNSSIDTYVTINDTRVYLNKGDNAVSVCYEQWEFASAIIYFGNGVMGTHPTAMSLKITNVVWKEHTPADLEVPDFSISGKTITFSNNNNKYESVDYIELGLFNESDELVFSQPFYTEATLPASGTIDTSAMKQNGEFTAKIRVIANLGYNDSEWSTASTTYEVTDADAPYTLSDPSGAGYGGGVAEALKSGKWEYFTILDEGAKCYEAKYADGTLTFSGYNGWSADCVQLARHFGQYANGTQLTVTMTVQATMGGNIQVCGQIVTLTANEAKEVTVTVTQVSGKATVLIILDTLADDHSSWPNKLKAPDSMDVGDVVFTVSNLTVTPA